MSSVVGTDVPAAALLVARARAAGGARPATRPWRRRWPSARRWAWRPGCARWRCRCRRWRFGYWLARAAALAAARSLLTAAGLATTLVVLLPWASGTCAQSGALYFTDDHGGITALIGANPNSEGTYTRALNRMFKDVTGRSVLDEPHRETDRAAYAIVARVDALRAALRAGAGRRSRPSACSIRSIRLLYWPILRPGVLVGRRAAWFAAHHDAHRALSPTRSGWR